jgi:hypothetical protein
MYRCGGGERVMVSGSSVARVGRFYGRSVLRRMSKIAFGKIVCSSLKWLPFVDCV